MQEHFCLLHCLRMSELPVLVESYFLFEGRAYAMHKRHHCIFCHKKEVHGTGQSIWSQWALVCFSGKWGDNGIFMKLLGIVTYSYWRTRMVSWLFLSPRKEKCLACSHSINMNKMNETVGYRWNWPQSSITSSSQMDSLA